MWCNAHCGHVRSHISEIPHFKLYSIQRCIYLSHGKTVDENTIRKACTCIDHYMEFFSDTFPNKVIPKMHCLEDRVVPWMQRWKCGMAFHGEQAFESLHAEFDRLQHAACGIKDKTSQLLSMMKSHHLKCSPLIQKHMIPTKKHRV